LGEETLRPRTSAARGIGRACFGEPMTETRSLPLDDRSAPDTARGAGFERRQ